MKAVSYNQRKGGTERPYAQESHRALQGITMCFCPSHHLASLIHPESFFFLAALGLRCGIQALCSCDAWVSHVVEHRL